MEYAVVFNLMFHLCNLESIQRMFLKLPSQSWWHLSLVPRTQHNILLLRHSFISLSKRLVCHSILLLFKVINKRINNKLMTPNYLHVVTATSVRWDQHAASSKSRRAGAGSMGPSWDGMPRHKYAASALPAI